MHIVHLITYFIRVVGTTDDGIVGQAINFRGDFIWDQLPTMDQVTDAAFKNIKENPPPLITTRQ